MSRKLTFTANSWMEYASWGDRATLRRIHALLADIQRNGYTGIGKPEPLRGSLSGWWSRRIDQKHRLVYRLVGDDTVEILSCRGHYDD